ncbi:MAG: IPTL-CTERM sorting domain-containing protein [Comamonadaceae bacterium]|nr:IPTL-CTERM sorting domain-containing protein [Comamonadaceae bacterium]
MIEMQRKADFVANSRAIGDKSQRSDAPAVPTTPTAVPTIGQWSLLGLSSILLMFGVGSMRRRQI